MTNEQVYAIVDAYLGGILALVVSIWSQGRSLCREMHGMRQEVLANLEAAEGRLGGRIDACNARIDALTNELRLAVQYLRDRMDMT